MTIARKLTIALLACVLAALAVSTFMSVRRETARFEEQIAEHQQIMGRALRSAVAQVWRTDGPERALKVVDEANQGISSVDIRWVWLDTAASDPSSRPWAPAREVAPVASGADRQWTDRGYQGVGRIFTYVAMRSAVGRSGAIEISESLAPEGEVRRAAIRQGIMTASWVFLAAAAVAAALGLVFVGRPMRALVAHAERVGAGDFSHRLSLHQSDEVGALAGAMNAMCEHLAAARAREQDAMAARLRAIDELRHADRLATVGRLAAGMAHELGTPLNVVGARAKPISSGQVVGEAASESARIIVEQVERMARLMRQLLDFARNRPLQRADTDLTALARRTATLLSPLAAKLRVALDLAGDEGPVIASVDATQMEQVLTNLVMNAVHASEAQHSVGIRTSRQDRARPEKGDAPVPCVCIEVTDRGTGIAPADLPQVFEPFFSTKPIGEGTGLGLSVAYGIVRDHGGWIEVESAPGAGSRFAVYLPERAR